MRPDEPGDRLVLGGRVTSTDGSPVAGAVLDVWQADANGAYSGFMPGPPQGNLRGKVTTGPCHGGTSIEGPVGTLAALHCYAALPAVTWGSELFGPLLRTETILTEPLDYRGGELRVPAGPGLGIDVDEERLARWRVG